MKIGGEVGLCIYSILFDILLTDYSVRKKINTSRGPCGNVTEFMHGCKLRAQPFDLIVLRPKELCPQPTVHAGPFVKTAVACRMPEKCTVCQSGLLRCDARVTFVRIPSFQMRIELNHRNRTIHRLQRSQNGQKDGMVSAQANDAWMRPTMRRIRSGLMVEDLTIALFHLLKSVCCIKWRDADVAAVDDA